MTFALATVTRSLLCWTLILWMLTFAASCALLLWLALLPLGLSGAIRLCGASSRSQLFHNVCLVADSFEYLLLIVDCFLLSNHLFGFFPCEVGVEL